MWSDVLDSRTDSEDVLQRGWWVLAACLGAGVLALACGGLGATDEDAEEASEIQVLSEAEEPVAAVAEAEPGCEDGREEVPGGLDPWTLIETYDCYVDMPDSEVKPKVLLAAISEFYGKDITLYGELELDDYYNYKFSESAPTHYSFSLDTGGESLAVYGRKSEFKQLFSYLAEHGTLRAGATVRTDPSHGDNSIYTLVAVKPVTEGLAGECCRRWAADESPDDAECGADEKRVPESGDAWELAKAFRCFGEPKGDVAAKVLLAAVPEFYGKKVTLYGTLEIDDYYNYKYGDAQETHYSFSLDTGGESLAVYGPKSAFRDLFLHLADVDEMGSKVVVTTDPSHGDNSIFTLVAAEPHVLGFAGKCCTYEP